MEALQEYLEKKAPGLIEGRKVTQIEQKSSISLGGGGYDLSGFHIVIS
jgi:hypothetical protein